METQSRQSKVASNSVATFTENAVELGAPRQCADRPSAHLSICETAAERAPGTRPSWRVPLLFNRLVGEMCVAVGGKGREWVQ